MSVYEKNGMTKLPERSVYDTMKQRCYNQKNPVYKHYGGRGIKVCDRWIHSFANFMEDMGDRPEGLTLERIDNNSDYSPDNCRWATQAEQLRNTRLTEGARRYAYKGQTHTILEWAEIIGVKRSTLHMRLVNYKWPIERAIGGIL